MDAPAGAVCPARQKTAGILAVLQGFLTRQDAKRPAKAACREILNRLLGRLLIICRFGRITREFLLPCVFYCITIVSTRQHRVLSVFNFVTFSGIMAVWPVSPLPYSNRKHRLSHRCFFAVSSVFCRAGYASSLQVRASKNRFRMASAGYCPSSSSRSLGIKPPPITACPPPFPMPSSALWSRSPA